MKTSTYCRLIATLVGGLTAFSTIAAIPVTPGNVPQKKCGTSRVDSLMRMGTIARAGAVYSVADRRLNLGKPLAVGDMLFYVSLTEGTKVYRTEKQIEIIDDSPLTPDLKVTPQDQLSIVGIYQSSKGQKFDLVSLGTNFSKIIAMVDETGFMCSDRLDANLVAVGAPTTYQETPLKPVLTVGSGFELPPQTLPWPSIRPWETLPQERILQSDKLVLENINWVLHHYGASPFSQLTDLHANTRKLLTTFAELDCYGPRSDVEYVGPVFALPNALSVNWPQQSGARIFAYLRPDLPGIEALLTALANCEANTICAMPGLTPELREKYETPRFRLIGQAVALKTLLVSADLVVTYGASGTLTEVALNGVPMLLVPHMVEQYLNSIRIEESGLGITIRAERTPNSVGQAINRLLGVAAYKQAAKLFAQKYAQFDSDRAVQSIAMAIQTLADGEQTIQPSCSS